MFAIITLAIILVPVSILLILRVWLQQTVIQCNVRDGSMKGKTVLVTGASAGIGKATALGIAKTGARLIICSYDAEKAEAARKYICRESGNSNVIVKYVNLASLQSVRKCAEEILREEERLDVIINNAGILAPTKKTITEDGLELTFATNYFGPFLLTNLLLDLLKHSGSSRIISLSSAAHTMGFLNLGSDDFHQKNYHWGFHYGHTKLAVNLFVRELSRRLKGTDVIVNAVHPGTCGSDLFLRQGNLFFRMFQAIGTIWWRSPEQGAQTSIYLATSDEVQGISGKYFIDCAVCQPSSASLNDDNAKRLWEISEKLTGLSK